ncbi:MAG: hypothetical protein ACJ74H_12100 [Thermoanaerobaculia bacterium]
MTRRITAVFVALLLVASFASAQDTMQAVLRPDSTVFAIDASKPAAQLEMSRRRGETNETLIVPTTDDDAIESDARLVFDAATGTVFVLWHRSAEGVDEICLASLNANDEWSDVHVVASGADAHRAGLQVILTHAREEGDQTETTLIHATWWSIGEELTPEYALVAFENGQLLSTDVADLRTFTSKDGYAAHEATEPEDTGDAAYPPLAMSRAGKSVDVLFGGEQTTAVTRVRVEPKRVSSEARIWRPSGKTTQRTPPGRLTSLSTAPVQAFVSGDRIVLYTPDAQFRYSVFDGAKWTPVRMIELDENLTSEHLLQQLHRSVEEATTLAPKAQ